MPCPKQRYQCCLKAFSILRRMGLLIIIVPDSSHQNKHTAMMKDWKRKIELIGFTRICYKKLLHLHCMAFSKTADCDKTAMNPSKDIVAAESLLDDCEGS